MYLCSYSGKILSYHNECRGVIHVGANDGAERDEYAKYSLNVLWFEPNPEVFQKLKTNIAGYDKQKAFEYLVSDIDDGVYTFHISNNDGQSSSIYPLHKHQEVWPTVHYVKDVSVRSIRLDTFMKRECYDPEKFKKLHIDCQGSEMLVLKGAVETLPHVKYVQMEITSMELYKGGSYESEVNQFLKERGFEIMARNDFINIADGTVSEIHYKRIG
jgi:FkbM family methyltransferase